MSNLFSRCQLPWSLHRGLDYFSIYDGRNMIAVEDIAISGHDDDECEAILGEVVHRVNAYSDLYEALDKIANPNKYGLPTSREAILYREIAREALKKVVR